MVATDRYPTLTVKSSAPRQDGVALSASHVVTAVGPGMVVKGHVTAVEHLIVEGEIEGSIVVPDHGVAISGSARVRGEVCARTITVLGRVDGSLTASALIELRATAVVTGRLAAPHLSMEEGARFQGRVHPAKAGAALAVARHRLAPVTATDPADT
jgi:cytoskeletal protein CcmA (bactofilin family)